MNKDSIVRRISRWADITPNACCFQGYGESFSYADLERRSNGLAGLLRATPGERERGPVLCFGDLNFHMIACFLACIKMGRPYIPVDSATPAERIAAICRTAGCKTVFATTPWPLSEAAVCLLAGAEKEPLMRSAEHRGVDDDVQEGSSPGCLIPVTAIENVAPCRAAGDFPHAVCGDENFYIIFTSGTTGAPKGVQISHNNLVSFTDWMLSDFDIGSGKRFLLQAPYSFDLSVMSLYPALLTGGTLVVVDPEMALDFRRLFAAIPAMDLDIWVSTPSFADVCLADADFNERANPHITHMIFCGDELTHRTAEKLTDRFPRARVFNTYGPTEATVAVTKIEIDAETLRSHSRLPVGYAKPDMTIAVVDKAGRRLPDGEEGEIIIAGPAVSKGYLNDPVRTAESFFLYQTAPSRQPASGNQTVSVRQPASGNRTAPDRQPAPCNQTASVRQPASGNQTAPDRQPSHGNQTASVRQPASGNQTAPAYHTGDAGIMRGGLLYYKGRLDFQVKFHGYRIEIQDIEQHLAKDPAVRAAMVVPQYREHKVSKLVAYIVAADFVDPDSAIGPTGIPDADSAIGSTGIPDTGSAIGPTGIPDAGNAIGSAGIPDAGSAIGPTGIPDADSASGPTGIPDADNATKQPATASAERALTASIKQRLAESVMDYMVPQKFLYVDSLPLTPNGKLDRKRATAEVNRAAILKEHPAAAHKARPATSRKARREVKRP